MHLRGFDGRGSGAALHSCTDTSFTVSGVFRDPADFCVLILHDADDFFGHPRFRYLPDTRFDGVVLEFDLHYRHLQTLESPKFPTIDWPYLDVARPDGSTAQIPLWDHATLVGGNFEAAETSLVYEQKGGTESADFVDLVYQNIKFRVSGGGKSANQMMADLAVQVSDWDYQALSSGTYGLLAAADASQARFNIEAARFGRVNTSGNQVTWVSGRKFMGLKPGDRFRVIENSPGIDRTIVAVNSATSLTLDQSPGNRSNVRYLAPHGGYDGNMNEVVARFQGFFVQQYGKFSGGNSDATWRVRIDFSALGISDARLLWLTFAPRLMDGQPFTFPGEEWDATFTNWHIVSDPNNRIPLKVGAPGTVRVEDTDVWCSYSGQWAPQIGFYSKGFARVSNTVGSAVTITYWSQHQHDLWLGTSLYSDRGKFTYSVDGGPVQALDCYAAVEPPINNRRLLQTNLAPGRHIVTLTVAQKNPASSGNYCYFDYLDALVPGDVPDPLPAQTNISPAIDYDTDHGYKLSPARLMWMLTTLGFAGPMNNYEGVFWWNQRRVTGQRLGNIKVFFGGNFQFGDQVFLKISGVLVGKLIEFYDSANDIALHFQFFINEVFPGVFAQADGNSLTITARSTAPAYDFSFSVSTENVFGLEPQITVFFDASEAASITGTWIIDPFQDPPLNYGARAWMSDLFREVKARNWEITTAYSVELTDPPDDPVNSRVWTARFIDGTPVLTDTGFGGLRSAHCAIGAPYFLDYQKAVFRYTAQLAVEAGVRPELQCGEFLWWFFTNYRPDHPQGGMAYYDNETTQAALQQLGRLLAVFRTPDDSYFVNGCADADFLATRLWQHTKAIVDHVKAVYPQALFEVLFPYDVNYPTPYGRFNLGGQLNNRVNLPAQWRSPATAGFDRMKIECLDFGSGTRTLDKVKEAVQLFQTSGWPKDRLRYLFPIFNGGCPWPREQKIALDAGISYLTPFAFDHVCLFGWDPEEKTPRSSG